jgi:transcriptional regulatory protein RtcR
MNHEARARFLLFAEDPSTPWSRNFRDLGAAVRRMGTLADGGRITTREVDEEVARLRSHWGAVAPDADAAVLAEVRGPGAEPLDPFEAVQLAYVVRTCRAHPTLAAAGRALFAVSRARRTSTNDGDRLRKYLAGYGLDFAAVTGRPRG